MIWPLFTSNTNYRCISYCTWLQHQSSATYIHHTAKTHRWCPPGNSLLDPCRGTWERRNRPDTYSPKWRWYYKGITNNRLRSQYGSLSLITFLPLSFSIHWSNSLAALPPSPLLLALLQGTALFLPKNRIKFLAVVNGGCNNFWTIAFVWLIKVSFFPFTLSAPIFLLSGELTR